jgi:glycosyltransferase involved in cell wall biosynthesis
VSESAETITSDIKTAVLIPCYNEAATIEKVVRGFQQVLPGAAIYVYDNNSTDNTVEVASRAGAVVRSERLQGKGNVVRRMFADIDADVYVMVDGDDTYDPKSAPEMVRKLHTEKHDLINGRRISDAKGSYRPGHRFGNKLLTSMVSLVFGSGIDDMLSGYKVFSKRFVKSFPSLSSGFEIETELVVHALELRMPIAEMDTVYGIRPEGSESKLSTYTDGFRILRTIGLLVKDERPLQFFSSIFALLLVLALILSIPLISTYLETGLVPRVPTAILVTGMTLLSFISLACGLILETVTRGRQELKRLQYLRAGSE